MNKDSYTSDIDEDITVDELKLFVGKSYGYYFRKWESIEYGRSGKITMNAYAFFLGIFWAVYRKFYSLVLIWILVSFILVITEEIILTYLPISENTLRIVSLIEVFIITLIIANYSNYWYLLHAKRTIKKIKSKKLDLAKQQELIRKKGGISFIAVILFIIIIVGIIRLTINYS